MEVDDKTLLIALHKKQEKAFDQIFHKYFESIYRFIYHSCKSEETAKDLTQEVFVKLWENSNAPIVSLKGYLYAIAKNTVINWTRQNINRFVFDTLADEQHAALVASEPDDGISSERLLTVVQQIAASMPKRRLEVYHMRWVEGLPRKEIARRMGITVTTVDIHLQKALEYLRTAVSKLPDESFRIALLFLWSL